jgi:hypothetical protein
MRIDQYHGAVAAHLRTRRNEKWWRELGQLLDAWGEESREVARHRGFMPWQLRLFRAFWIAWVGIMLTIVLSGGWS